MTNNTWHKLCNEWRANAINEEFRALCRRTEMDPDEISARQTAEMKWIRNECKKQYVWLEDFCEADIYVELMPFGGYTSLTELKAALNRYRKSGRSNAIYREICG